MDPQLQHADTVPGFTMQSEGFYLKFITGLQCGVSSKLLEYETDWYEVMEILLSRLQDEPENKERFEIIASRDLEYWARIQPGGDTLNLKIRVSLEEKRYHLPPNGTRKNLRLIFNDRFSTEVIFYARKKMLLKSLKDLAAVGVADHFSFEESIVKLGGEIPNSLIPNVQRAFQNCWTARFWRSRMSCPSRCQCKMRNKTPLVLSESKAKTPTNNTRRQLLYKKVADKHVRTAQQKKVIEKKVESKNSKLVKGSNKKGSKNVKKVDVKNNSRKQDGNISKRTNKKLPVTKSVDSGKTKAAKSAKSTQKKSTIDAKQSSSRGKAASSKDKKSTPGVKKNNLKKTADNVKALKDKVRAMKNRLKTLMEAVAVKSKVKGKSEAKKNANNSPKRNASKRNALSENGGNPVKKRKVDVKKPPKPCKEEIFSPRPTRRTAELVVNSSSRDNESKSRSKNTSLKSKSNKRKSSDIDAKFTKSTPNRAKFTKSTSNDAKFTKSPKQKMQRASPRSMPPRNKSKSSKSESKLQKPKQLKRSLRSQGQEVPSKKRRQG